jgi:Uma2 family endonuclease
MPITMADRRRELMMTVRAIHEELNLPDGYQAEIIDGLIIISAIPDGHHACVLSEIRKSARGGLPADCGLFQNVTLEEPDGGRYIPDLALWPERLVASDTEWALPGNHCAFTAEVTSPEQEAHDYKKGAGYGRAGVPVFLLVDRSQRSCVVYSEPAGGRYTTVHTEPFGNAVKLPLETPVTLDTSRF